MSIIYDVRLKACKMSVYPVPEWVTMALANAPDALQPTMRAAWSWWESALTLGDPRVRHWPLMNPYHMITFAVGYLLLIGALVFVMKFREKGFKITWFAIVRAIKPIHHSYTAITSYHIP